MGCVCAKPAENRNSEVDTSVKQKLGDNEKVADSVVKMEVHDKSLKDKSVEEISQLASVSEKKKKKKKKKEENAEGKPITNILETPADQFLNAINSLRTEPKAWADKIEASISNIGVKNGKKSFKAGKSSVTVVKGEEAFKNMASKLRTMSKLPPLEMKPELCFDLPDNADDYKAAMPNIQGQLANMRKLGKFTEVKYFFDIAIKEPETSILLQCVDDNESFKGQRSEVLLRSDIKYVGVSIFNKPDRKFAVYLCYAK
jgi:hypothetical protein